MGIFVSLVQLNGDLRALLLQKDANKQTCDYGDKLTNFPSPRVACSTLMFEYDEFYGYDLLPFVSHTIYAHNA